jgi:hypothetical protein
MQILAFPRPSISFPPESDDMATQKERLDGIDAKLGAIDTRLERIDVTLGLKPPEPKKKLWFLAQGWIKENPGAAIIVSILLAVFSISTTYWLNHRKEWWNSDVDGRVREVLKERNGVYQTLGEVQRTVNETKATLDTLKPFIDMVVNHQYELASKLSASVLKDRLPAISALVAVAQNQKIAVNIKFVRALGGNLLKVPATNKPSAWPVTNEMLGYYSTLVPFSDKGYILWPVKDKTTECITDAGNAQKWVFDGFLFEHCTQHLDTILGPDSARRQVFFKHLAFRDVRVIYSGKPLTLNDVVFINCVFELQAGEPSRLFAQTLLAQNAIVHLEIR